MRVIFLLLPSLHRISHPWIHLTPTNNLYTDQRKANTMIRFITTIALLTISSISGFATTRCQRMSSHSTVLFAQDEMPTVESKDTPSTAGEAAQLAAVRCPDCDLCDGSGRYVYYFLKLT